MSLSRKVVLATILAVALPAMSVAQWSVPANGPLATTPLVLKSAVPPNVMFALSVEFPTANTAAYQGASDYSSSNVYLGLFDNQKCYDYDDSGGYFVPKSKGSSTCTDGYWSGNFLNWATMTGLDEFRHAMTGGNRYLDTASLTVLERTYQSGQGGTSNFPDKTFSGSGATSFPKNSSLTIQNQHLGVQMQVAPSNAIDTANCKAPTLSNGNFSCSLSLVSNDGAGSCSAWSGTGTNASPYTCAQANVSFDAGTPTTWTTLTTSTGSASGTAGTVICASPSLSGSTFGCGTLTLNGTQSGTCSSSYSGDGSIGSPYTCSGFNPFGGILPFSTTSTTTSTFTTSGTASQTDTTKLSCAGTSGKTTITCSLSDGSTATCTADKGSGTKSKPYYCSSKASWTYSGTDKVTGFANSGTSSSVSSTYFYYPSSITYDIQTTVTHYYVSTYTGQVSGYTYYYYSTYNVGFTGSKLFNVRVKVCDSTIGREDNCQKYQNGASTSYKPTGVVQSNGDMMRFGVTSYYQANDIDNAVLRSKAKYVAPNKWSESGQITNANAEWSATDGTLVTDPDSGDAATHTSYIGTTSKSGVINYINQFGSNSHTYKTYDDVGKLYYETLNYLTGSKSPTANFYTGAASGNADGFPVITTWDDPVLYSCQKNYIITMGDTHTWCDKRLPGGTYTSTGNNVCNASTNGGYGLQDDKGSLANGLAVDVTAQTNWVGNKDGLGNIATNMTGAGGASYYMAGLAHWAAANDIRTDFTDKQSVDTFVIDVQEYKDCGYESQYWLAAKYGNINAYDSTGTWLTTNNPAMDDKSTLPTFGCGSRQPPWADAGKTVVSWPKNLLKAGDPKSMIDSVNSAIATILDQNGQIAVQGQSSGSLIAGGAYLYQSTFDTKGWVGDLTARLVSTAGVLQSATWSAAANLPAQANRVVYTFNDGMAADGTADSNTNAHMGTLFSAASFSASPSGFSSRQRLFLNADPSGVVDNEGANRVNYLRGDQSNEAPSGLDWRARTSLLGDIVNSAPVYVGAPRAAFRMGTGYQNYVSNVKSRTPVVYVGANDGMLHGFDASTGGTAGKELMAFVPSSVYYELNQLMWPTYVHHYFVDGSPVVADVCTGTCSDSAGGDWKTMLVSGLRAGGKGLFALNVTDPLKFTASAANAASTVLWEFTSKDDHDLGYTFGTPVIRKTNAQTDTGSKDAKGNEIYVNRWAVIFGNGYNDTTTPTSNGSNAVGEYASSTGRAYLYVAYIEGPGSGSAWSTSNYAKIELKSPSESTALPLNPPNGVARLAAIDKTGDGAVDYIYAGDLHGNLWKIDVSNSDPSKWGSAFTYSNGDPKPLFTAIDTSGNPQPITGGIQVSQHPDGGYMILFGTGSFVFQSDGSSTQKQSIYGIWDQDNGTQSVPVARSTLQKQELLASGVYDKVTYLLQSNCTPNYTTTATNTGDGTDAGCPTDIMVSKSGQQFGWVYDFPTTHSGERVVMDHLLLNNGILTVTSLAPSNADPCAGGSTGWIYDLDYLTGGRSGTAVYSKGTGSTTALVVQFTVGSGTVDYYPSGIQLTGGSDTPSQFQMAPVNVSSNVLGGSGGGTPTSVPIGNTFIRGWGVPFYMKRGGGGAGQGGGGTTGGCSPTISILPGVGGSVSGCNQAEGVVSWRTLSQ